MHDFFGLQSKNLYKINYFDKCVEVALEEKGVFPVAAVEVVVRCPPNVLIPGRIRFWAAELSCPSLVSTLNLAEEGVELWVEQLAIRIDDAVLAMYPADDDDGIIEARLFPDRLLVMLLLLWLLLLLRLYPTLDVDEVKEEDALLDDEEAEAEIGLEWGVCKEGVEDVVE